MLKLLQIFEELFDGTLVIRKTDVLELELKEDVKPICLHPYPVPKVHKKYSKKGVESLVLLGLLSVANDSEWVASYFA